MKTLTVILPGWEYNIQVGWELLARAGEEFRAILPGTFRIFVVTDSHVAPLCLERIRANLEGAGFQATIHTVPAGESSRCAARLAELWEVMTTAGLTRTDTVTTLGGNVMGGLAGFAAATILWRVSFVQTPTTLLVQVDSSVGGEVAADLGHGKSLVGAFWQPRLVLMSPEVLDILPLSVLMEGMVEVVEYGCIRDAAFFDFLTARPSRAELMAEMEYILYTCCTIKQSVVEQNEWGTGKWMLLNFGHTPDHAYELAEYYAEWSYGAAVVTGMCAVTRLGIRPGVVPAELPEYLKETLSALGLLTAIPCTAEDYAAAAELDGKGTGEDISVILLECMGYTISHRMPKAQLPEEL